MEKEKRDRLLSNFENSTSKIKTKKDKECEILIESMKQKKVDAKKILNKMKKEVDSK